MFAKINDIATDLDDVPVFVHAPTLPFNRGRDMAYPEAFNEVVRRHYPDLGPLTLDLPLDEAYRSVLELARAMPRWTITFDDGELHTFEGIAVTRLCRFRDDFVVRVREGDTAGTCRVDMRSKSRLGTTDFGANASRIRAFFKRLRGELA